MATRGPATVSRSVRALGAAVHDLRTGRHEPNEPRGSRSDLWGAAGEIPAAYPADVAVDLERRGPAGRPGRAVPDPPPRPPGRRPESHRPPPTDPNVNLSVHSARAVQSSGRVPQRPVREQIGRPLPDPA